MLDKRNRIYADALSPRGSEKLITAIVQVYHHILTAAVTAVARMERDGTACTEEAAGLVKKCIRQLGLHFLANNGTDAARCMYLATLEEMSLISRSFPKEFHIENQAGNPKRDLQRMDSWLFHI